MFYYQNLKEIKFEFEKILEQKVRSILSSEKNTLHQKLYKNKLKT